MRRRSAIFQSDDIEVERFMASRFRQMKAQSMESKTKIGTLIRDLEPSKQEDMIMKSYKSPTDAPIEASRPIHFWEEDEDLEHDPSQWCSDRFETDCFPESEFQDLHEPGNYASPASELSDLRSALKERCSIPKPWKQLLQDILRRLDEFEKGLPSDIVKASQTLDAFSRHFPGL